MIQEAIILAGGLGTRLRKVVKDVPKPMADINGKPFLWYLLNYLNNQGIEKVILSVGYKYEIIKSYFGDKFKNLKIIYSIEKELLGTGGAIKKALSLVEGDEAFVLNGDTFFDIDLNNFYNLHKNKKSILSIALKYMCNFSRYGRVLINENNKIIAFEEKKFYKEGYINGGIYILKKDIFKGTELESKNKFSLEKDLLENYYKVSNFYGFPFNAFFIDIGIPEDYEICKIKFKRLFL